MRRWWNDARHGTAAGNHPSLGATQRIYSFGTGAADRAPQRARNTHPGWDAPARTHAPPGAGAAHIHMTLQADAAAVLRHTMRSQAGGDTHTHTHTQHVRRLRKHAVHHETLTTAGGRWCTTHTADVPLPKQGAGQLPPCQRAACVARVSLAAWRSTLRLLHTRTHTRADNTHTHTHTTIT